MEWHEQKGNKVFDMAVADWPGPLVEWPKRAKKDRNLTVQRLNGKAEMAGVEMAKNPMV